MRALLCTDAVGGVLTYTQELRDALALHGVEATVAAIGPQAPPDPRVHYMRCRLEWQEQPWEDVDASAEWLCELAEELRADVVNLAAMTHGAAAWPASTVAVVHSCLLSWQRAVRRCPAPAEWRGYRERVAAGLSRSDALVAPTRTMLAQVRELYALHRTGTVIGNGISLGRPQPGKRERVILAAGRMWDEAKGLRDLAAAAARLPWPVEVAGEIGAGATDDHITLLGQLPRPRLRSRMAQAAIFAHPARYEPFGLAPLEAAAAGCALVLGDIGTLRELWDGAAVFVAPGRPRALAEALLGLAEDEQLRSRMAALARERATHHSAHEMGGAYAHLYERLTARRAAYA